MGYFDEPSNVSGYIKMCEGYDGADIIDKLRPYLKPGSTVLELGMGPGKDLDILKKSYTVTGSDRSRVFFDLYQKCNPESDLLLLDAVELDTDRTFDGIYIDFQINNYKIESLNSLFTIVCFVI